MNIEEVLENIKRHLDYVNAKKSIRDIEIEAMYKEIERLKEENKKYNKWIESLNKDNHRLNNIINEMEYWLRKNLPIEEKQDLQIVLNKLQELKGSE